MAEFLARTEADARALLADARVRFLREDAPDTESNVADVLAGATFERGRIVAEPPVDDAAASAGMGAWHVNAVNECHTVVDGDGIVEFVTADGPVAVRIGAGDVMAVERAEHRYRPLRAQGWILRFAGPADGDLGARDTGRTSGAWPTA